MKRAGFTIIMLLISLLAFEILSGYFLLQHQRGIFSASFRLISDLVVTDKGEVGKPVRSHAKIRVQMKNPFVTGAPKGIMGVFHPFIDYTGVHIWDDSLKTAVSPKLDFFGFRNDENLYFNEKQTNEFLIIMTGGSECAGWEHSVETITQYIQKKLQAILRNRVVRVLNLCMNSVGLAGEMQSFLHLGYGLKPDVVISHTGWNDVVYGLMISDEFRILGLNYNIMYERWLPNLYGSSSLRLYKNLSERIDTKGAEVLIPAFWRQADKFHDLVRASGAKFIMGLQDFKPTIADDINKNLHQEVHKIYSRLPDQIDHRKFVENFHGNRSLKFMDSIHTNQSSVKLIGDIYIKRILDLL